MIVRTAIGPQPRHNHPVYRGLPMRLMRTVTVLGLVVTTSPILSADQAPANPPQAPVRPRFQVLHDEQRVDN